MDPFQTILNFFDSCEARDWSEAEMIAQDYLEWRYKGGLTPMLLDEWECISLQVVEGRGEANIEHVVEGVRRTVGADIVRKELGTR